jgi:hypothetical protein
MAIKQLKSIEDLIEQEIKASRTRLAKTVNSNDTSVEYGINLYKQYITEQKTRLINKLLSIDTAHELMKLKKKRKIGTLSKGSGDNGEGESGDKGNLPKKLKNNPMNKLVSEFRSEQTSKPRNHNKRIIVTPRMSPLQLPASAVPPPPAGSVPTTVFKLSERPPPTNRIVIDVSTSPAAEYLSPLPSSSSVEHEKGNNSSHETLTPNPRSVLALLVHP